ncbi:MAG TPA: hypothetical protein VJ840_07330 [Gemmatimonadaceae bacterium]|nr:hypothetical protein [Gemmatimonadaceae bacterium]
MNVLLFGATGMVGDGVLHECLADPRVASVLAVTRSPLSATHAKLREIRRKDFFDYRDLGRDLEDIDACFFCLGVSSIGMKEHDYYHLTYDLTLSAASALASAHPNATFCYVSGEGTDSTERGRRMWARVKGKTENALLALPLDAYMFRPGFILPRPGTRSKTLWIRLAYSILVPLYPVLSKVAPTHMTTLENVARAMIRIALNGYPKRVLENTDINQAGTGGGA